MRRPTSPRIRRAPAATGRRSCSPSPTGSTRVVTGSRGRTITSRSTPAPPPPPASPSPPPPMPSPTSGPSMALTVSNPSAEELPYGFGIHPYFRLPIVPGGDPDRTRVVLPASNYWVLDGYIPTGEIRPVDDRLDFRKGQPRTHLKLDDVLTGLAFERDQCVCRLVDQALGAEFRLGFDRNFRELVVFTPPPPMDGVIAV